MDADRGAGTVTSTEVTDVLVVGAGPTGLVLACDLARRGIAVRIVDRSPAPPRTSRAKGPNPRSLEILDDLGVAEAVLAAGSAPLPMLKYRDRAPVARADPWAGSAPSPDAAYDRAWLVAQWRLEEILRARLAGYGVRVELGREVVGLTQPPDAPAEAGAKAEDGPEAEGGPEADAEASRVVVTFAEDRRGEEAALRARYVVGCDGAHSSVRKLLGIGFEGTTREDQVMVCGDVELAEDALDRGLWHQWFDEDGAVMLCPIPGTRTGWWFQAGPERDGRGRPLAPTADGFRRLLAHHTGLPGQALTRAELLSTYRVNVRMADRFRAGRVFLAGDAAHVHAIAGGLGMNTGIQDAFNLGWKLGEVLAGRADPELLDTYEEERLPVAARTLDLTSERLRATLEAIRRPGGGLDSAITADTTGLGVGYRWSSLAADRTHLDASTHPDAGSHPDAHTHPDRTHPTTVTHPTGVTHPATVTHPTGVPLTGGAPLTADEGPQAGDRAPDAPCTEAATGTGTRLHRVFAGPRTTVLGFGSGSAAVLDEVAATYGGTGVRTCRVYAADEDRGENRAGEQSQDQGEEQSADRREGRTGAEAGPPGCAVIDAEGHAAAAYGTGASARAQASAGGAASGARTGTIVVVRPDHHVGLRVPADDARSVREYLRRLHGTGHSAARPPERSSERFPDRFPDMVDAVRKG
ncbi:monooxygenase [Streptomyces violaceoruber]|uniref:Monooxygenase n=1 Tax=Streptomyces violaceoruber TaxID=1935 RepID=A0A1V0UEH0_STRVN|nr:FAD-dependent monooxygenase [Streptomyces violaceoruber]ARF63624.1 monooxygenase [Streptomyces violaceoruber]